VKSVICVGSGSISTSGAASTTNGAGSTTCAAAVATVADARFDHTEFPAPLNARMRYVYVPSAARLSL